MQKSVALFVCVILFFSMLETGEKIKADDLRYEYVNEVGCSISITSGTATVISKAIGKNGTTSINITVYVESYYNGEWNYYTSWTHSGVNQNNTDSTSVAAGIYRVWMSVSATSGGNTESFNVDGNMTWYLGN
ncbi:MAG: hypothetical protein IKW90_05785 [Lachnospiraceae bacterium]|nr:hypothetical protein [Lachnospiraceae bacterium]MBR5178290.1 hypothetical protein [Lachnospiraceae bacterium]